jgi:hypothetical protein
MASAAYERRIASYLRRHPGATRQDARGHAARNRPAGSTEHGERRRRTVQKYGVSPGQLTKLRRQVIAHVLNSLDESGTKGPVDDSAVILYVNHMPGDWLRDALEMSGAEIKQHAAAAATETADDIAYEFNPFWYHAQT